jgi:hypothetical protein
MFRILFEYIENCTYTLLVHLLYYVHGRLFCNDPMPVSKSAKIKKRREYVKCTGMDTVGYMFNVLVRRYVRKSTAAEISTVQIGLGIERTEGNGTDNYPKQKMN